VLTKSSGLGTRHIGPRAATNVFHAARFATAQGRPLSLFVTINWDRLGVSEEDATNQFRVLRQKVRRRWVYVASKGRVTLGTFDDLGVHENPSGHRNTHWLISVPQGFVAEFKRTVTKFLQKVLGLGSLGRGLRFKAITAVGSLSKYVMKGIEPSYSGYFHMRAVDQGFIAGRGRTFVSRSIGLSARRQSGWTRKPVDKALACGQS
jgi:hypothetical protein